MGNLKNSTDKNIQQLKTKKMPPNLIWLEGFIALTNEYFIYLNNHLEYLLHRVFVVVQGEHIFVLL